MPTIPPIDDFMLLQMRQRDEEFLTEMSRRPPEVAEGMIREVAHRQARELHEIIEEDIARSLARALEEQRRRAYGPVGTARERMDHYGDVLAYGMAAMLGQTKEIPVNNEPIAALADLPKEIKDGSFTATLIDTTRKVKSEGENMQHCMGWSYMKRIAEGRYAAYHITAAEGFKFPKSGLTLGFNRKDGELKYDQLKGKKNDTHHCGSPEILAFVEYVDFQLNPKKEQRKCKTTENKAKPSDAQHGDQESTTPFLIRPNWLQGAVRRTQDLVRIVTTDVS